MAEEKDFKKEDLLEKYMVRMLYRQDNSKFKNEYLKKLKKNQQRWKSVSLEKKP